MELTEISNAELLHLHEEAREVLEKGAPLTKAVEKYGIRDEGGMKRWAKRIEGELDRRHRGYSPISWRDRPGSDDGQ